MFSDLLFALRQVKKSPGFAAIVVLTLALGIGANTAIFSIVNAVLLEPLPYPHADRLVQVCEMPQPGAYIPFASGGAFADWQDESTQLQYIAAEHDMDENLTGSGEPVRLSGEEVTADYLKVFGVVPALGRDFLPSEDTAGGNQSVVILSHEIWQTQFSGDPAIVGRAIHLDGKSLTVIGVLPPHALFDNASSFLVPAVIRGSTPRMNRDYNYVVGVTGRLKPGATLARASAELADARRHIKNLYPAFKQPWSAGVESYHELLFGNVRPQVLTLFGAVGVVLLIACVNVANLLLARSTVRRGEIALRLALGATPFRIVRQMLTESLLFALVAGAAGLGLGIAAIHPLVAFTGIGEIVGASIHVSPTVLAFTVGASCATAVIFGLVPALSAVRSSVTEDLKNGSRGSTSGGSRRAQSTLLISETALTVVLLACAGLLLRSFQNALRADPGFNPQGVILFDLSVSNAKAPETTDKVQLDHRLIERLRAVPGVTQVAIASSVPMNGNNNLGDLISREDRPLTRNDSEAGFDGIDGDFFPAMQIPLLRGRDLDDRDDAPNAPKVLVVNDVLAKQFFGSEDPLGRQLHFKDAVWTIVGVVGSVRRYQLDFRATPQIYFSPTYFPWRTTVVVRTNGPTALITAGLRQAVREVDAEIPIAHLHTLQSSVDDTLRFRRVILVLLGVFGTVALALACIGIYGVISYSAAQRTREIGIRIALGASARQVLALILKQSTVLVAVGIILGLGASLGAGSLIANQLYDVSRADPVVLASVSLLLLAVGAFASWAPAFRATRINPTTALRSE